MSTKTYIFRQKMAEKIEVKVAYPLKMEKKHQIFANEFFAFKLVLTLKSHPETWEAYLIKWTTSVEPLVGLKSHWHFHFWSNKQLLSVHQ